MPSKQNGGQAASTSSAATLDPMAELSRHQVSAGVQARCALFRGFETIRGIQERAAHEALAEYQKAAGKLARPGSMFDLLAVQAELLRFDAQRAALYWQQLGAAALEMQRQIMGAIAAAETTALQEAAASAQEASSAIPGLQAVYTRTSANTGRDLHPAQP